eukprot:TRINITY_DN1125_c0_g4_i1.p1 TRINITY_DN1125_c0_g4~~TRINITY_DN1125_c0_g4_i1.p1  ORF type:complete len:377 (+),score=100.75 TRINITY_DN1125_c0_g4_i1:56-1186(+)
MESTTSSSAAAEPSKGSTTAMKQWELENKVRATDEFYKYDASKMKLLHKEAPWKKSAQYFTSVKMSALALVKIVMHAKTGKGKAGRISADSGNWIEVMGVMQGYVTDNTLVVLDSFALPVEAHEVECNLTQQATEYLVGYKELAEKVGKGEPVIGWYHSHPGYQCFLSKTDCTSQRRYQQYSDPFLAVVVDPVRTISTGKVEVKAFRTLPEDQVSDEALPGETLGGSGNDKIAELGVYAHWYYELPIEVFKCSSDEIALQLLWGKFWSSTLASSPLATNRFFIDRQIASIHKSLERCEADVGPGAGTQPLQKSISTSSKKVPSDDTQLSQATAASDTLAGEVLQGLLGMVIKDAVFNLREHTKSAATCVQDKQKQL